MVTITAETVAAAADRLHGDGTNPTQSAVRTALGGGSFSTIGPLLHKWRDNQAEAAKLAKVDLPDTLADAGADLMSRVWKVAIAEALAGHDALRKELIQAQVETEFARKETTDVAASLEADLAARDERITALEAQSVGQAAKLKAVNDRGAGTCQSRGSAREPIRNAVGGSGGDGQEDRGRYGWPAGAAGYCDDATGGTEGGGCTDHIRT